MISLTINGVAFSYPQAGDLAWENGTNGPTEWAQAVTTGMLSKAGGLFSLTADANFGPSFGLQSIYFRSGSANPAGSGVVRLASADAINWRNNANSADISLAKNTSDQLTYAGTAFLSNAGVLLGTAFPALTGDVTTTAGSLATSLVATSNGTLTSLSALTSASALATVGTIGTGTWQGTRVASTYGGTGIDTHLSTGYPSIAAGTWSVASSASTFTTLYETVATTLGDLVYGGASGAPTRLAGDTSNTRKFLRELSSGGVATAPVWDTVTAADVGATATPTASTIAEWDAHSNFSANNLIEGYATNSGAGTYTLSVSSAGTQVETGTTASTYQLPVTSTLVLGQSFCLINLSSATMTVQSSGGNTLQAMVANTQLIVTCISTSGTGTASWNWVYTAVQNSLSGGGTVTSVTFTGDGTVLSSTPSSAVTTSGTVTAALNTQAKNTVLAGPTSGSNAAPTFRALSAADLSGHEVTNTYFNGYLQPSTVQAWVETALAYTDGAITGGGTTSLTTRASSGITVTAAASNKPGITFTPAASTAVYLITATFPWNYTAAATFIAFRLYDGANEICVYGGYSVTSTTGGCTAVLSGVYVPGTASPVTVTVQGSSDGSHQLAWGWGSGTSAALRGIDWQIVRIA